MRGARIVVFDGEGVRAPMIAAWLRQMGWEAHVLAEGLAADLPAAAPQPAPALPVLPAIDAAGLAKLRETLLGFDTIDAIQMPGLSGERRPVIAGGLLIFVATVYFWLATRRHLKARALRLCLGRGARKSAGVITSSQSRSGMIFPK